ncbi:MAG: hypothetical protein Q4B70_11750 [Lachnospiraceae bacterium]|nr:hypothetical protein [Lachnospiraceae bacterium]
MPTDKQIIRDRDYYGEYQAKSHYSVEQWEKILTNESFVPSTELAILKEIFSSANHAATLTQLSFHHKKDSSYFVDKMNQLAEHLGKPNGISVDVDLEGKEYWWFLLFWGKNTKNAGLEWKLIPELAEAMEYTFPDLETDYNSYMKEIESSQQIRYSKEDSVWIAASLLLYEKYYLERPTDVYDLLLMQYEVQQRAQQIHGQDVDVEDITDTCNADSSRCQYPYLRDIDKYWRVTYPGEIEDAVLRPAKIDYEAYVPSKFGYMKLTTLCDFIETDYCKIADPNYIEIDESNPFYKITAFLRENGKQKYMDNPSPTEDDIEHDLMVKDKGKEALEAFHSIGNILTEQYPDFFQSEKASWLERDNTTIRSIWQDSFITAEYENAGPALSVMAGQWEEEGGRILYAILLTFPIESPELTNQILEKCNNLTVLTSADFRVEKTIAMDTMFSTAFGNAIAAYAVFDEQTILDGTTEEAMIRFETVIQILASYYLDLCGSLYQQISTEEEIEETIPSATEKNASSAFTQGTAASLASTVQMTAPTPAIKKRKTNIVNHPDRKGALPPLYPRNLLFTGPKGCGKRREAILTAVGIIENVSTEQLSEETYEDILKRYQKYREEGRILFTGNIMSAKYEDWMEGPYGEGLFVAFANHATEGNYVFLVENMEMDNLDTVMGDAVFLLPDEKREGQPEYETVSLKLSLRPFSIPSNLYFIGITQTPSDYVSDFLPFSIRHMEADPESLTNLVVKGLPVNTLVSTINTRLAYLLGPDYQIGQRFFEPLKKDKSIRTLGTIMYERIFPLLLRWFKEAKDLSACENDPYNGIRLVFGDYKKSDPSCEMITKEILSGEEIFGGDFAMEDKIIYRVQKEAFFLIESYLEMM